MPCCWCGRWVPQHDADWSTSSEWDYSVFFLREFTWWWRYHKVCYSQRLAYLAVRRLTGDNAYTDEQAGLIITLNGCVEDVADAVFALDTNQQVHTENNNIVIP